MTARVPFSDPGGGIVNAPIGSEEWAQRVRLEMQAIVKDLPHTPERFARYKKLCDEHRIWVLLNKRDGSRFKSWEEFCEHPEPWGLGRPVDDVNRWLSVAMGKQALQLVTAPPDGRADNRRGGKRGTVDGFDSSTESKNQPDHTAPLLRAILRAPQPVQQLYRDGLIGQKVAAKLGPDRPTPEQAAQIAEIVEAVRATPRPKAEHDKAKVQREVNDRVRSMLGDGADDPVAKIVRLVAKLNTQQIERLRIELRPVLGELEGA
jgi:hypothetical protein